MTGTRNDEATMKFAGRKTNDEFYGWLNPDLPHNERFSPKRLLSEFVEVGPDTYDHFLGILPPRNFTRDGFTIMEATTGDIRLGFFRVKDRLFAAHISDNAVAHDMTATRNCIEDVAGLRSV